MSKGNDVSGGKGMGTKTKTNTNTVLITVLLGLGLLTGCSKAEKIQATPFPKERSTSLPDIPGQTPESETREDQSSTQSFQGDALLPEGPWVVFRTATGIWGFNEDGSGLTEIYSGSVVAPLDLKAGYHQPYLAFVTTSDPGTLQNLTLQIITIPNGELVKSIPLAAAQYEPEDTHEICDPKYEAARAVTIANGLAWNGEGNKLAFVARINGPTSDLYLYDLDQDQITQLTDGPSQAYDVNWSASGDYIIHFGASCFGTGAGFAMNGVWAARSDNGGVIDLYDPPQDSGGEVFLGNYWSSEDSFYAASWTGCPYRDLRLVEVEDQLVTMVHEGCFWDYALGPTGLIAVLTNEMISDQPGVSFYMERNAQGEFPLFTFWELDQGSAVDIQGPFAFVQRTTNSGPEVVSLNINDGSSGWYQGQGDIPLLGPGALEDLYVWLEGDRLYLVRDDRSAPVLLTDRGAEGMFWFEDLTEENIVNRLVYVEGGESGRLVMVSSPDFIPEILAEGLTPRGGFSLIR